jgi:hypothetical protein
MGLPNIRHPVNQVPRRSSFPLLPFQITRMGLATKIEE